MDSGTYDIKWDQILFDSLCKKREDIEKEQSYYIDPYRVCARKSFAESDPNGLSAKAPGSKLDLGKPDMTYLKYFPRALREVVRVCEVGAKKYSRDGWEKVPDGPNRYLAACLRHILTNNNEEVDIDTGLLHRAQVAWNALASLELWLREQDK